MVGRGVRVLAFGVIHSWVTAGKEGEKHRGQCMGQSMAGGRGEKEMQEACIQRPKTPILTWLYTEF